MDASPKFHEELAAFEEVFVKVTSREHASTRKVNDGCGRGFTVTVTCIDAVHPLLSVPVTVYVIVEAGVAVTEEPVVELSAVAGVHEYVEAPLAVNVALC